MITSLSPVVMCCLRRNGIGLASKSNQVWSRCCSNLALNQTNNHIDYHSPQKSKSSSSVIYQHSFGSINQLITEEKADVANYILLEDKTMKLHVEKNQDLEIILNSPVADYWEYWIKEKHYYLIKLADQLKFNDQSLSLVVEAKFPIKSRTFCLTKLPKDLAKNQTTPSRLPKNRNDIRLKRQGAKSAENLSSEYSLDKSAKKLTSQLALSKNECKLRFFITQTLEELFCDGVFSAFHLIPFGSSVNSLGWGQSGLDLCLVPKFDFIPEKNYVAYTHGMLDCNAKKQRTLKLYSHLMKHDLVPGVNNANQPNNQTANFFSYFLFADVSITCVNPEALDLFRISSFFYEITKNDERILHLLHFTKLWAEIQGLITPNFNNILLNMIVVSYLQVRQPSPILLPMETFFKISDTANPKNLIREQSTNFSDILQDFLHYLGTFDYAHSGFNPFQGKIVKKPTRDPLFILDPARGGNMGVRVPKKDLDNLTSTALNSFKLMESGCHPQILLRQTTHDIIRKLDKKSSRSK